MRIDVARNITFKAANKQTPKKTTNTNENPITVRGERSKLVAGTFIAGLGFGFKELLDLFDGDLICDTFVENGCNVAQKNFKNASNAKRALAAFGASMGLMGLFVAGIALLYTLFNAPKINYEGKVNAFQKSKDMDVYVKGNNIEKKLYTQLNEQAKVATEDEKNKLREQYVLLQMAKNKVPEFAQFNRDFK